MVKKPFESKVSSWLGKPLSKLSIKLPDGSLTTKHGIKVGKLTGELDVYPEDEAGYQEIVSKNEGPDHMEVVKWRNGRLMAAAKAAANTKWLKEQGFVEPTAENDPSILFNTFYTAFLAVVKMDADYKGRSEDEQKAEARRRATEQSGIEAPDDDDEN